MTTNTPAGAEMAPCPFCNAGSTQIRENGRVWLGQRYGDPASVSVFHWCEPVEGQPSRAIERVGRDRPSAIAAWNRRASLSPASVGAEGWKSIDSAPKDGTAILLGRTDDGESGAFVGQGRWVEEDDDGPDNMGHDAGFVDDQFDYFRCGRSFGNPKYQNAGLQPTHWMPLPPPPGTAASTPSPAAAVGGGGEESKDAARYRAIKARHAHKLVKMITGHPNYNSATAPGIIDAWADAAHKEVAAWDALTPEQRAQWWDDAARAAQQGAEEHGK